MGIWNLCSLFASFASFPFFSLSWLRLTSTSAYLVFNINALILSIIACDWYFPCLFHLSIFHFARDLYFLCLLQKKFWIMYTLTPNYQIFFYNFQQMFHLRFTFNLLFHIIFIFSLFWSWFIKIYVVFVSFQIQDLYHSGPFLFKAFTIHSFL